MMIAFCGMGLLGSGFVRALRRRGETVYVWNRTPEKARALEADGAKAFDDPAEAARGASRVHLVLSDDAAVDALLERIRPGLDAKAVIVDHTTTSHEGTAARAKRWAERGVAFQHAPVFMGPQNALESTGLMLASGDRARFDALAPELAKMTGKLVYVGEDPARAAAMKLLGNSFLMAMTAGLADVLALAKAMGVPAKDAASLFDSFNPAGTIPARIDRMMNGAASASWTLAMARKDARIMIDTAKAGGVELAVIPGVAARMDERIAEGHAQEDWTIIGR